MIPKILLCTIIFCLCFQNVRAQKPHDYELLKTVHFKPLVLDGRSNVLKVIDPQTLLLDDGRTIKLSGLYFPDLTPTYIGPMAVMAKNILEDFLLGKTVIIYKTPTDNWGRMNRMGHYLAHLQRQSDQIWVQGLLLSLGLAQVNTNERIPQLAREMYVLEDKARAEKIGLWTDEKFGVRRHEIAKDFMDSFQIVEGRIESVAIKNSRIYLNFGLDWRNDFTVSIPSEHKNIFNKQNINPLDWNKKFIRARGWVRDYNGPFMEITHPQAVQILD